MRRVPYAYVEALWFLLLCVITGGTLGVLIVWLRP